MHFRKRPSGVNTGLRGIAIKGYDPVAYFNESRPVKGRREFSYTWANAKWYFASRENRDRFVANPGAYAPAYGGYCAWATASGKIAGISPKAWQIRNGILYFNFSKGLNRRFFENAEANINHANEHWPVLKKKLESD